VRDDGDDDETSARGNAHENNKAARGVRATTVGEFACASGQ